MKSFFKMILASFIGTLSAFFSFLFMISIILSVVFVIASRKSVPDKSDTIISKDSQKVVHLVIDQAFNEVDGNPLQSLFENKVSTYLGFIQFMEKLQKDKSVAGVLIESRGLQQGWASLGEMRRVFEDFKKKNKFIDYYSLVLTEKDLFLGSAADQIYTNPRSYVELNGFQSSSLFYKEALETLNVDMYVFKAGSHKSFAEPFSRTSYSPESRAQTKLLIGDLWDHFIATVAQARKLEVKELNTWADALEVRHVEKALEVGLIDGLKSLEDLKKSYNSNTEDEVKEEIEEEKSIKTAETLKLHLVSLSEYEGKQNFIGFSLDKASSSKENPSKNQIAYLPLQGSIVASDGDQPSINLAVLSSALEKIRKNKKIKGMVVRINSGGGSSLVSDVIWKEFQELSKKFPVWVSMGDVAASGGYYIAMTGGKVFAEPNTVTGSIGVIAMIPNMEGFYKDKLKTYYDSVKTHTYAGMFSGFNAYTPKEQEMIQAEVYKTYNEFKAVVMGGREAKLTKGFEEFAEGRVWTGNQALEIGLIDELGGLREAIKGIASHLKLKKGEYSIVDLSKVDIWEMSLDLGFLIQLKQHFLSELKNSLRLPLSIEGAPGYNPLIKSLSLIMNSSNKPPAYSEPLMMCPQDYCL